MMARNVGATWTRTRKILSGKGSIERPMHPKGIGKIE